MDPNPAPDDFDRVLAELQEPVPPRPEKLTNKQRYLDDNGISGIAPVAGELVESTNTNGSDIPIVDEMDANVRAMLGVDAERWNTLRMRALKELGKMPWVKINMRAVSMMLFDSIQKIETTMDAAAKIINSPNQNVTTDLRIAAGSMMANCAKSMKELSAQVLLALEKGVDTSQNGAANKPKNRPPSFGVQVNVQSGGAAQVALAQGQPKIAGNGNTDIPA